MIMSQANSKNSREDVQRRARLTQYHDGNRDSDKRIDQNHHVLEVEAVGEPSHGQATDDAEGQNERHEPRCKALGILMVQNQKQF